MAFSPSYKVVFANTHTLTHVFSPNLVRNYNSNPISAWHGAAQKNLDSICWYGLLNLSTNDPGMNAEPEERYRE